MSDPISPAAVLRDLFTLRPAEPGAWKVTLRTGIISSITLLTASVLFGPTIGAMALFGAMLAQWEVGRGFVARVKTALIVGATMTASMALGVSVANERLLVIPITMAVILLTSTAYYSFVLTRGPGPLHLFYAAAIGSYFGMFGDIGWHGVEMTAFSTAMTGVMTWLILLPDLRRPERTAVAAAEAATEAFCAAMSQTRDLTPELRLLRHRAYFAVNRAWLLLQDTTPAVLGLKVPRVFTQPMLDPNRRLGVTVMRQAHPQAEPIDIAPDTAAMLGRPGLGYLIRHGFRPHSIASFTAVRIAFGAGIAGALTEAFGLGHPYWAILTAAIVLHLWVGRIATTLRALHRAVGTALGLCVVYAVGMAHPSAWALVLVVVGCTIAMTMLLPFSYALAMIFVTPMSLLSIDAATGGPVMDLVQDRFVETLIGAGTAIVVTWVSGLREPERLVRAQIPRSLAAMRRTLAEIAGGRGLSDAGRAARVELLFELLQNNAVLSRSSQEDPTLSVWQDVETLISDTGYLVLGAYWTKNWPEFLDVNGALSEMDRVLGAFDAQRLSPEEVGAEMERILKRLQSPKAG